MKNRFWGAVPAVLLGILPGLIAPFPMHTAAADQVITIELLDNPQPAALYGADRLEETEGILEYPTAAFGDDYSLLASISPEARMGEEHFSVDTIHDLGDGVLLISYFLTEPAVLTGEAWEEEWNWGTMKTGYVSYDLKTGRVLGEIPPLEESGWCEARDDGVLHTSYQENDRILTWYSKELEPLGSLTLESTEMPDLIPGEVESGYYTNDAREVIRLSLHDGETWREGVEIRPYFAAGNVLSTFRAADGTEYLLVSGWNGEIQPSRGILNVGTGEFVRMDPQDGGTYYTMDGCLVFPVYSWEEENTGICGYRVSVDGVSAYSYLWQSEEMPDLFILSDGRLLFVRQVWTPWTEEMRPEDYRFLYTDIWLADGRTGQIIGTKRITASEEEGNVSVRSAAAIPGTDAILLQEEVGFLGTEFYCWTPSLSPEAGVGPQVTSFAWKQAEALDLPSEWNPENYVPGPVPEELSDLKERAVQMGEQYGFQILISEECHNLYGGYAVAAENDRKIIQESLDVLEEELEKYPEGFFDTLLREGGISLELWLAGSMTGLEMETLESAGGFADTSGDQAVIVMDVQFPGSIVTTLHHEFSHIIDRQIIWNSDEGLLSDDSWISLNPSTEEHVDLYTYTYTQNGYADGMSYTYYGCKDYGDVYFVDDYSMTFPTEDRARLFENVMCGEDWGGIAWEDCPHLREKLNVYASAIRKTFGEDDWDDVPWERYMDETGGS